MQNEPSSMKIYFRLFPSDNVIEQSFEGVFYMNRDRGNIKWNSAMMLPEFAKLLSEAKEEYERSSKPILDEQKIEENEQSILAAMEYSFFSEFTFYDHYSIQTIKGYVHFIDYNLKFYRIFDAQYNEHIVAFEDLLAVENLDEVIPVQE